MWLIKRQVKRGEMFEGSGRGEQCGNSPSDIFYLISRRVYVCVYTNGPHGLSTSHAVIYIANSHSRGTNTIT